MRCPFCNSLNEIEVEAKIGVLSQMDYKIGDKIIWANGGKASKGKRPTDGNFFTDDGYAECDICNRDFWVDIDIQNDVITKVSANEKKGYK